MEPTSWQRPGLRAALLYAFAAGLLGTIVSAVSRLELTRRAVPDADLPEGPVIVVANHTSFADGILLALVGRRLGRSLRLMATGGVFRSGLAGPLARRLGFIPVLRGTDSAASSLDRRRPTRPAHGCPDCRGRPGRRPAGGGHDRDRRPPASQHRHATAGLGRGR